MRSVISMVPLLGLAVAQDYCGPATVTKTEFVRVTVSVPAPSVVAAAEEDITITSTIKTTTTIYATPVAVESQFPKFSHYPFSNSTVKPTHFPTNTPYAPTTLSTEMFVVSSDYRAPVFASSKAHSSSAYAAVAVSSDAKINTVAALKTFTHMVKTETLAVAISSAVASAALSSSPEESDAPTSAATVKGTATFYGGNVAGGHCSFTGYTLPSGLYGTAFGGTWDASECGACISVTGPNGKSIKAMIVDQCPECTASHLDVFEDAFTQLGSKSAGIIDISYTPIECGITSPITLKNKSGTSASWFSIQVVNSNTAVAKVEVSTNSGMSWESTTRQSYNFWEIQNGTGTSSVDVKITDVNGKSITVTGASTADGATKVASGNF